MRVRVGLSLLTGLALMIGFQNCAGPTAGVGNSAAQNFPINEKASVIGRFEVDKFISTSSCPDIEPDGLVCAAIYQEEEAQMKQVVEFLADGTLIIEGACNTYYSKYKIESNGSLGRIAVGELSGTSAACDGLEAEEESLLVYRLSKSVRVVEEGSQALTIFTDQSSALRLEKHL